MAETIISIHSLLDFQPGLEFSLYKIISALAGILHIIANHFYSAIWDEISVRAEIPDVITTLDFDRSMEVKRVHLE